MAALRLPVSASAFVLLLAATLAAGCASGPQLGAQYVDPQLPPQALRGATVLVVCDAVEPAIRLNCETRVSGQLVLLGARPVTDAAAVNPNPGREPAADLYLGAARAAGARAVFSTTMGPDFTSVGAAPVFSFGIGGFGGSGGYRGGSAMGGGVGVAMPVGPPPGTVGLGAIGSLIDVQTGRVMWSAKATAAPAADVAAQINNVTATLTQAAAKTGLF